MYLSYKHTVVQTVSTNIVFMNTNREYLLVKIVSIICFCFIVPAYRTNYYNHLEEYNRSLALLLPSYSI